MLCFGLNIQLPTHIYGYGLILAKLFRMGLVMEVGVFCFAQQDPQGSQQYMAECIWYLQTPLSIP